MISSGAWPRSVISRSSTCATRVPGSDVSTSIASDSRVKASMTQRRRILRPQARASLTKSRLQSSKWAFCLLEKIACPTLVAHNREARFTSPQIGQRMAAAIPAARFLMIEDLAYKRLAPIVDSFVSEEQAGKTTQSKQYAPSQSRFPDERLS